ncbi:hypothetical protein EJ02DRAFT_254864 [Clathrospora elynae]|uniref:RRM domain-containing protein n=1 Tax=Clathrospora elynae TaxID=706981 RepID=A0A6A5SIP6_9PLEO|nr:hypothetical protein EJ02DRAFT_254864 [Clathrospora elynae]
MNEVDEFLAEYDGKARSETPPMIISAHEPQTNRKRKNAQEPEAAKKPKVMENRAVYISNLPLDTNKKELEEEFSRFGIIDKGIDGEARIKLYYHDKEEKQFTGDALVTYFRKESIPLAIEMMDDYFLRPGDQSNGAIHVEEAGREYKKVKDGTQVASKFTRKDKKVSEANRLELNRKLAEWSDNEEEVAQVFAPRKNKWAKVVIIKNVFDMKELEEEDEASYLDIKEDMRFMAEKFGDITNCTLYDKEPEGIVTVRFRDPDSAEAFKDGAKDKTYDKRKLEFIIADEKPRFKKSGRGEEEPDSEEEEEQQKLEKVAKA